MITIGILNSKGGVGKTTLCTNLAVRAAQDAKGDHVNTCIVDLDPQESTRSWHGRRGNPSNPALYSGEDRATDAIEALSQNTPHDWVFLDGAPGSITLTRDAVSASDLIVIPVRASMLDIDATRDTVTICLEEERAFVVVLNAVSSRTDRMAAATVELLEAYKIPLAQQQIIQRVAHVNAMTTGKTGLERDAAAASEIDALWREVKQKAIAAAKKRKG